MAFKKTPLRTCIGCGEKKPKNELISVIRSPKNKGAVSFEVYESTVKKDGRSAYICKNPECFKNALKHKKLEKSFKCKMDKEIYESIENIINKKSGSQNHAKNIVQNAKEIKVVPKNEKLLNFLGITKKSGNIVLGMDCVKKGVLEKDIGLILITEDISNNSFEEIKKFAFENNIGIFKISYSKDNIFNLFGKYSAIIGIKNENFIDKIIKIINSSLGSKETQSKELNREECNI